MEPNYRPKPIVKGETAKSRLLRFICWWWMLQAEVVCPICSICLLNNSVYKLLPQWIALVFATNRRTQKLAKHRVLCQHLAKVIIGHLNQSFCKSYLYFDEVLRVTSQHDFNPLLLMLTLALDCLQRLVEQRLSGNDAG
jgi:hypothetical protein